MFVFDMTGRVGCESTVSNSRDEEVSTDWADTTRTHEDIPYYTTCLRSKVCLHLLHT